MNETMNLEEYRCRKCGRLFYVDAVERSSLDIDFGCPYGCDDNGEHTRDIVAEVKEDADGRINDLQRIRDYKMLLSFSVDEFEQSMGRSPHDQGEFDAWGGLIEDDLLGGLVDWNTVLQCACEAMRNAGDER